MSDPIAEAAAQLDAAPSSTEPQQPAPEVAQAGEPSMESISALENGASDAGSMSAANSTGNTLSSGESPNGATPAVSEPAPASTGEHPHTSILRRLTETLRRKWNVFDGELEAILKDAESHL